MTMNQTKMIKENIKLSACQDLDHIHISHKIKSSNWFSIGRVILLRTKTIGKNRVQIKYRKDTSSPSVVLKAVVPADIIVERRRLWVEADGEENGYWERQLSILDVPVVSHIPRPELPVILPMESIMQILMGKVPGLSPGLIPTLSSFPDYTDMMGIKPFPEFSMMPVGWEDDFLKTLESIKDNNGPCVVIDSHTALEKLDFKE